MSEQWTAPGSDAPKEDRPWTPTGGEQAPPLFPGEPTSDTTYGAPAPGYGGPPPGGPAQPYGTPPQFGPPQSFGPPQPYGAPVQPGAPPSYGPPPQPGAPQFGAPPRPGQAPQGPPGAAPGWRAGLEFRPGIIPLRPLQLGDIYGGVIKAVRGNVAATMGLAALTSVIVLVPLTALGAWMGSLVSLDVSGDSPTGGPFRIALAYIGQYLPVIGSLFSTILLTGFVSYVIGQGVLGRKVGPQETAKGTFARIWSLIGASLLVILATFVALALLIGGFVAIGIGIAEAMPPNPGWELILVVVLLAVLAVVIVLVVGYGLSTMFTYTMPAVVLERRGPGGAIARSWRLVGPPSRSVFWRVVGIRLLTYFIVQFIAQLITMPVLMVAMGIGFAAGDSFITNMFMWQAIIQGVTSIIVGALTTPFLAGVDALLFVDARIRQEGLDVQLMQATSEGTAPPWARATGYDATPRPV